MILARIADRGLIVCNIVAGTFELDAAVDAAAVRYAYALPREPAILHPEVAG